VFFGVYVFNHQRDQSKLLLEENFWMQWTQNLAQYFNKLQKSTQLNFSGEEIAKEAYPLLSFDSKLICLIVHGQGDILCSRFSYQ
jgi:hypothetical protein